MYSRTPKTGHIPVYRVYSSLILQFSRLSTSWILLEFQSVEVRLFRWLVCLLIGVHPSKGQTVYRWITAYYFKVIGGPTVTGTPVGSRTVCGPTYNLAGGHPNSDYRTSAWGKTFPKSSLFWTSEVKHFKLSLFCLQNFPALLVHSNLSHKCENSYNFWLDRQFIMFISANATFRSWRRPKGL